MSLKVIFLNYFVKDGYRVNARDGRSLPREEAPQTIIKNATMIFKDAV